MDLATELYRAMSNMRWKHVTTGTEWSCSWRYAGGVVAQLRSVGEGYMDFYCSGGEGSVSDEVKDMMASLGWEPFPWPDEDES